MLEFVALSIIGGIVGWALTEVIAAIIHHALHHEENE